MRQPFHLALAWAAIDPARACRTHPQPATTFAYLQFQLCLSWFVRLCTDGLNDFALQVALLVVGSRFSVKNKKALRDTAFSLCRTGPVSFTECLVSYSVLIAVPLVARDRFHVSRIKRPPKRKAPLFVQR